MKLRIHENSIRLRLGRSEVQSLLSQGKLECVTVFPPPSERLIYGVTVKKEATSIGVSFSSGELLVTVPLEEVMQWASTDQVAITGEGNAVSILVEKDFACLEQNGPKDEDAFENPLRAKKR